MKIICGISNFNDIKRHIVLTSAVILDFKNPIYELENILEESLNQNIVNIIKDKSLAFSSCIIDYKNNNLSIKEAKCLGMLHVYHDLNIGIDEIWIGDFYRPSDWNNDRRVFNFLEGVHTKPEIIASSILVKEASKSI